MAGWACTQLCSRLLPFYYEWALALWAAIIWRCPLIQPIAVSRPNSIGCFVTD